MQYTIPKGTYDVVPLEEKEKWRSSYLWHYLEECIYTICNLYSLKEIRTPIFERLELFQHSVGEETDIVSKEMYLFEDRAGRQMALRPEGTASVMRAFIENQLYQSGPIHKLFYVGPMFRYERPQAGRYRQHTQFGVEMIGDGSPEQDAETIDLAVALFSKLGLKGLQVQINSVGDPLARSQFRKALKDYLIPYKDQLSNESQVRLEKNTLRILDSKDPNDQKLLQKAPVLFDFLEDESKSHFNRVLELLEALKIPFIVNHKLVRGLDYYTRTVFEVTSGELGAQNSVLGGGRYDGLIKRLGGPDLPAVGFAAGLERVLQTLLAQNSPLPKAPAPLAFIIGLGEAAKQKAFLLTKKLRAKGLCVEMDFTNRKVKDLFRIASQIGAQYTLVIGDDELQKGEITLKEMASRQERRVPEGQIEELLSHGL